MCRGRIVRTGMTHETDFTRAGHPGRVRLCRPCAGSTRKNRWARCSSPATARPRCRPRSRPRSKASAPPTSPARSTPRTRKTRSNTCRACWCASATSATTTTPCCRRAPPAPATARARPCTRTASCCRTTSATAPPSRRAGAWSRPSEIERVDVLYGPFSAAYGGNSVGAVVDYVTRMPRRFEAHAKIRRWRTSRSASTTRTTVSTASRAVCRWATGRGRGRGSSTSAATTAMGSRRPS